jgi:hypothetical protein
LDGEDGDPEESVDEEFRMDSQIKQPFYAMDKS